MALLNKHTIRMVVLMLMGLLVFDACKDDDEDTFPITNDLRVLQVRSEDQPISSGVEDLSVISPIHLIFSHALNTSDFESSLTISPEVNYELEYDASGSQVTIVFVDALEYETAYTIRLPQGTYGAGGQSSVEDFSFDFATAAFEPPGVSLSVDENSLFEGQTLIVKATLDRAILEEVTIELDFAGTAEGDGVDYSVSKTTLVIPSGGFADSLELNGINDGMIEGEETITVSIASLENAVELQPQILDLTIGDTPPQIELKGVMSIRIGGTSNNGRAVHLRVLEDIADLSVYGLGIANNGGGSDGREIDFPSISVSAGDDLLVIRDADASTLSAYYGDCYTEFDEIIESDGVNFNGDDPFELYDGMTVIETYGDVELDGTGEPWEYTGSWAYKLNGVWEYGVVECAENVATIEETECKYPFCVDLQLQGALAILWDGSGTNGGKAVHVRANRDIADLSEYGIGVANNGGGTDGVEFTFPSISVEEGDHILLAREPATIGSYFGGCIDGFDEIIQSDAMNQNGDDAVELFRGMDVIETYGDANVDGTGEPWEYSGAWAYKLGGIFTTANVDCAAGSTSTQTSACPYAFCQ